MIVSVSKLYKHLFRKAEMYKKMETAKQGAKTGQNSAKTGGPRQKRVVFGKRYIE